MNGNKWLQQFIETRNGIISGKSKQPDALLNRIEPPIKYGFKKEEPKKEMIINTDKKTTKKYDEKEDLNLNDKRKYIIEKKPPKKEVINYIEEMIEMNETL